ncbi:MAG: hypothetical protein K8R68_09820 [Bacteroidales bacterium]|nr:hypothetical protein [Bacteroidales bacterium]
MNRILNILTNPFVISIPIALLVVLLLPFLFNKYELKEVKYNKTNEERQFYHDLNHDGFDEYIQLSYGRESKDLPFLSCNTDFTIHRGYRHLHEINFDKQWLKKSEVNFGDYNADDKDELCVFTRSNDSLYLLIFEPLEERILRERFIAECIFHNDVPDFGVTVAGLIDLNGDKNKEFIFSITAGLSLSPRAIYIYDIYNDSLIHKDLSYAFIDINEHSIAYDKNRGPVIISNSFASRNYKDTTDIFYSDTVAWLMAFDKNLNLLFKPIRNNGEKGNITAFPVEEDSSVSIYAYFRDYVPDGKIS